MKETEIDRLLFAKNVRELAVTLRAEARALHMHNFCATHQRSSSTPGKTWNPIAEDQHAESSRWEAENPLDSFLAFAMAELRRVDALIQQL